MNAVFGSHVPIDNILSFTPLSTAQQQYLTEVYAILGAGCLTTWGGYHVANTIHGLGGAVSGLLSVGLLIYILASSPSGKNANYKRMGAFFALTGLMGASLAPLIDLATMVNPAIVSTALLGTATAFISFSMAAMFAKERKFLALGGSLFAATSYLAVISLANYLFRSQVIHSMLLWGGLALNCLYVLYYTQGVIYEFDLGKRDKVRHALLFYVECVDIFVKMLRILLENERRKRQDEDKRRR